jgi:hypothetical protein
MESAKNQKNGQFQQDRKKFPLTSKDYKAGNEGTKNEIPLGKIRSRPPNKVIDYSKDTLEKTVK